MSAEGESPAEVGDHPFCGEPWWDLCRICNRGIAAHFEVSVETASFIEAEFLSLNYRCPFCVDRGRDFCEHGPKLALGLDAKPLNREVASA